MWPAPVRSSRWSAAATVQRRRSRESGSDEQQEREHAAQPAAGAAESAGQRQQQERHGHSGHSGALPGRWLRASVVMGVVTVRVTVVEPAPEAIEAGEKLAVAPLGRPEPSSVIAAGKVVAGETGLTVKV